MKRIQKQRLEAFAAQGLMIHQSLQVKAFGGDDDDDERPPLPPPGGSKPPPPTFQ